MMENIESSQGQLFSSHVLLALVAKGLSRETAYSHVQRLSHSLGRGDQLREKIVEDSEISKYLNTKELDDIFSGKKHKKSIKSVMKRGF